MDTYTKPDAPFLPAYSRILDGSVYWVVWCKHCDTWHRHGPADGHREAHCQAEDSPYFRNGYNLAYAGRWIERN